MADGNEAKTTTPISSTNICTIVPHPSVIFDADISSVFSEVLGCELIVFTCRNMEGSPLTERKKQADPSVN